MGSQRFRELVRRVNSLRRTFLPPLDPTGTYTVDEHDRVRAFKLLVHAELESYVEDMCVWVADQTETAWQTDSRARTAVVHLLAFSTSVTRLPPDKLPSGPALVRSTVEDAKRQYSRYVKSENNGIREKQILRLLLPIGAREVDLPAIFLADLDTLGASRGAVAHTSFAVQTPPDPLDALQLLTRIVAGFRRVDQLLIGLGSE